MADELKEVANALSEAMDADLLVFNYELMPPVDIQLMRIVAQRPRRKNIVLFLTTEGGLSDSGFRIMRFLQSRYERVTVVVAGWCKSGGTLMCIGAHELILGDLGELGPLDVQIVKADEMDERKSGLVAEAAFEKLQEESFKFFMNFVKDIGNSDYRVTLKTAFDMAARMTIGVVQPIFDKLDPVTIGEDYRSNRLASAYADRLNIHSKNLIRTAEFDALEHLLSGYYSHGFDIDLKEAENLFKNVKALSGEMLEIVGFLGSDAIWPRSRRRDQDPRLEFLNDEPEQQGQAEDATKGGSGESAVEPPRRRGNRAADLPRNPEKGGGEEPPAAANA